MHIAASQFKAVEAVDFGQPDAVLNGAYFALTTSNTLLNLKE